MIQALGRIAAVFFDNPSQRMTTIGVTGSSGKTTTTWLVRGMFEELQQTTGLIGERFCQELFFSCPASFGKGSHAAMSRSTGAKQAHNCCRSGLFIRRADVS